MKQIGNSKWLYWTIFLVSLVLAYLQKTPCFTGSWSAPESTQYRQCCYSDLQALYSFRALDQRKIPYVEEKKFEYPPLIGFQMYLTSLVTRNHVDFFKANALVNTLWAVLAFWLLILCFGYGRHLLWFAAVPQLVFYLHLNWDISSVTALVTSYYFWKKDKNFFTGAAIGIGFTGKMFPLFAAPALVIAMYQDFQDWKGEIRRFVLGFIAGWALMNSPIVLLDLIKNHDYHALLGVFGFHTARTPDFGTIWYWIGEFGGYGPVTQEFTKVVDRIFLVGMALFSAFALWKKFQRDSSPWTTAAAITAFCLVISKIHSPQYGLWFLGFYVILNTPWYYVVPYMLGDLFVFLNGFWWIANSENLGPHLFRSLFIVGIAIRAVTLLFLAFYWVLKGEERKVVTQ